MVNFIGRAFLLELYLISFAFVIRISRIPWHENSSRREENRFKYNLTKDEWRNRNRVHENQRNFNLLILLRLFPYLRNETLCVIIW